MDEVFMVRGHGFDFVGNSPHTPTRVYMRAKYMRMIISPQFFLFYTSFPYHEEVKEKHKAKSLTPLLKQDKDIF